MEHNEYWVEDQPPESVLVATYSHTEFEKAQQHAEEIEGVLLYATFQFSDSEVVQNFKSTKEQERAT